jgi:hypothetical protein
MRGLVRIGVLLVIAWILGFVVFRIAGFLIHVLLIVGAVILIAGFLKSLQRRSAR